MNHFLLFFVIALLSLSTFASGGSIDNSLKGILLEKFTISKGSKVLGCQKLTLESFLENNYRWKYYFYNDTVFPLRIREIEGISLRESKIEEKKFFRLVLGIPVYLEDEFNLILSSRRTQIKSFETLWTTERKLLKFKNKKFFLNYAPKIVKQFTVDKIPVALVETPGKFTPRYELFYINGSDIQILEGLEIDC